MNLRELYIEQLQDIYSAETQLVDFLHQLSWKARSTGLKQALGNHLDETKGQVDRLKQVFANHSGANPDGHTCQAMKGLVREGKEALDTHGKSEIIDAHLVANASRIEHYEIAAYTTAISIATSLDYKADVELLKESLKQEKAASNDLEKMAGGGIFSQGLHAAAAK
ncbi:ferritin-like domain-containing protein [Cerasicoccus arenae]|uniref:YciE/YciF family protein n=1 Tax=Cerasicoccus arenae TaxID=424488 RepID=A0A8J3DFC1_9BACT|nr:DUF892 family protein [Cerasicoccus arenae]MBK1857090.1 DUF892 family protein [Cerasicoccus arenae]GHB92305.1 YciE/YciF family protein [Cerasicoccus arenae]